MFLNKNNETKQCLISKRRIIAAVSLVHYIHDSIQRILFMAVWVDVRLQPFLWVKQAGWVRVDVFN